MLKITRDELPMEQGVYGGCPLCPLYSLLQKCIKTKTKLLFRLNNQEIIIIRGEEYNVDILYYLFCHIDDALSKFLFVLISTRFFKCEVLVTYFDDNLLCSC